MLNIKNFRDKLENWMVAITFAEAGEQDTAREYLRMKIRKTKRKRLDKRPTNRMENRPTLEC